MFFFFLWSILFSLSLFVLYISFETQKCDEVCPPWKTLENTEHLKVLWMSLRAKLIKKKQFCFVSAHRKVSSRGRRVGHAQSLEPHTQHLLNSHRSLPKPSFPPPGFSSTVNYKRLVKLICANTSKIIIIRWITLQILPLSLHLLPPLKLAVQEKSDWKIFGRNYPSMTSRIIVGELR